MSLRYPPGPFFWPLISQFGINVNEPLITLLTLQWWVLNASAGV